MGQCVTSCRGDSSFARRPGKRPKVAREAKCNGEVSVSSNGPKRGLDSGRPHGPKRHSSCLGEMVGGVGGRCVGVGCPLGEAEAEDGRLEQLFQRYRDEQQDVILSDGVERLCADLGLHPADFLVLAFAWKCNAATMCCFTRCEFFQGCRALRADSIKSLRAKLPAVHGELRDDAAFRDLYCFAFQFALEANEGQRALPRATAAAMWRLVFVPRPPALLPRWLVFLDENPEGVRGVSRDTWQMFLNFAQAVEPDMSGYSEDEAWPSLFDAFAEWQFGKQRPQVPGAAGRKENECLLTGVLTCARDDYQVII
uniref:DCN1-like protein n=1 Tax=Eptatretus burgeri TaxID=7764 RepID=A0A8C4R7H0_EPTBU